MNKLGFSEKEVGRMTLGKFKKLYGAYKQNFDIEMTMNIKRIRYKDIEQSEESQPDIVEF
jgi:hypothetical protein